MTSPAQHAANKENATRSTGPRTPNGKARASRNATKHGLLSQRTVLPDEDVAEYQAFCDNMKRTLDPRGGAEELRFEEIVACEWRLLRANRLELSLFVYYESEARAEQADQKAAGYKRNLLLEAMADRDTRITDEVQHTANLAEAEAARAVHRSELLGAAFIRDARGPNAFVKLSGYEARLVKRREHALEDLERLQTARREAEAEEK